LGVASVSSWASVEKLANDWIDEFRVIERSHMSTLRDKAERKAKTAPCTTKKSGYRIQQRTRMMPGRKRRIPRTMKIAI
jgi:hypothetical protein